MNERLLPEGEGGNVTPHAEEDSRRTEPDSSAKQTPAQSEAIALPASTTLRSTNEEFEAVKEAILDLEATPTRPPDPIIRQLDGDTHSTSNNSNDN